MAQSQLAQAITSESEVYSQYRPSLQELICFSLSDVATLAAGKKLISNALKRRALDKQGDAVKGNERAMSLVEILITKTKRDASVIEKFFISLEDSGLDEVCKVLKKDQQTAKEAGEKNPGYEVLDSKQHIIAEILLHNLNPVAGRLLEARVISTNEHSILTDPNASHDKLWTTNILGAIGTEIDRNSKMFDTFLDDVLDDIGGPAREIAKQMRELRDKKIKEEKKKFYTKPEDKVPDVVPDDSTGQ